ncbi:hypothetical protein psyc5s11_29120 [Clostridium gelidum]|uniref:Restriction endonuclease type IV Mrr domain-containing protein n=1 Tax=Clostridium gelidum TaxID=704125 RepID=A0ABM7T7E7_9CLOT|nr:restriction endonuclease [Clostridium gelidum]BCZ46845.1 hypothetical protein psyc5s11_29120 [Clostridium gelidum]
MRNKRVLNTIAEYIILNFNESKMECIDYLCERASEVSNLCEVDIDFIEEELIDRNSPAYTALIEIIKQKLKLDKMKQNLCIEEVYPFFYIKNIRSDYKEDENAYKEKLEYILKHEDESKKGYFYQELVVKVMEDLGVKCEVIKKSYDGGIDIIGEQNIGILNNNIIFPIEVYGQVKCYNNKVKPAEIKQLIKDEIYYLMESNNILEIKCIKLLFISHCGFTEKAKEYANNTQIILFDSEDLIGLLLKKRKSNNAFNYIEEKYNSLDINGAK